MNAAKKLAFANTALEAAKTLQNIAANRYYNAKPGSPEETEARATCERLSQQYDEARAYRDACKTEYFKTLEQATA